MVEDPPTCVLWLHHAGTSIDLTNATIVAQTLATAQVSLQKVVDAAAKQAAETAAASAAASSSAASSTPIAVVGSRRLLRAVARFSLLEDANSTQPEDSMDSVTAENVGGERVTVQGTNGTGSSNSTQAGDDYEGDSGDDEYPAEDDDGTVGSQSLDDDPYGDSYGDFNGTSLDNGTVAVSPAMPSPEGAAPSPASLTSPSPAAVGPGPAPLPSSSPQQQQGSPLPSPQPTGSPEHQAPSSPDPVSGQGPRRGHTRARSRQLPSSVCWCSCGGQAGWHCALYGDVDGNEAP